VYFGSVMPAASEKRYAVIEESVARDLGIQVHARCKYILICGYFEVNQRTNVFFVISVSHYAY
jgi:hypothetical protein